MKLSAKTEYACLALLQLAEDHAQGRPTPIRSLAERQAIPDGFLVQILQDLRRAGLVDSTRGATGGYRLSRGPDAITLSDVLSAVECNDPFTSNLPSPTPLADVLIGSLNDAREAQCQRLRGVTLSDLADRAAVAAGASWCI